MQQEQPNNDHTEILGTKENFKTIIKKFFPTQNLHFIYKISKQTH